MDLGSINANEEIFKIDFKWFNEWERKHILSFKLLYSNPSEFFKIYKKKETPNDTKNWVYEGISPAFHNNPTCDRLNSDYINFLIPEEIKKQGENKIQEFRNWFKQNEHLLKSNLNLFLETLKVTFNLAKIPDGLLKKNGGFTFQNNFDLETLETQIYELIQKAYEFYNQNATHTYVLDNYGINVQNKDPKDIPFVFINYSESKKILEEFEQTYKLPIKYYLKEYYRVKYNPKLEFQGKLLEQLGFKPCRRCSFGSDNSSTVNDKSLSFSENYFDNPSDLNLDSPIIQWISQLDLSGYFNSQNNLYLNIIPSSEIHEIDSERIMIKLNQLVFTKNLEKSLNKELIYQQIPNFNRSTLFYEVRSAAVILYNVHGKINGIKNKLNDFNKPVLYRTISKYPLIGNFNKELMNNCGQLIQDEIINKARVISYQGQDLYIQYHFNKEFKDDQILI